jgi:abhydrolase domain-containing protein 6
MKKHAIFLILTLLLILLAGCASTQKSIYDYAINIQRSRANLEFKTVQVDGEQLSYLDREGNGETIVLLHGLTGDKNNWLDFVRFIPKNYRVLVIDLPGHGDNAQDMDNSYDPVSLSRGVGRVLDKLGITRCHIAGNSLGGLVSEIYASEHPDKVITLGLFDAAYLWAPKSSKFQQAFENGQNYFDVKSRSDYDRLMGFVFYDPPFMPWPILSVASREYINRNTINMKIVRDVTQSDYFTKKEVYHKMMARLSMPTFVLWGDKDNLLDVSCVESFKRFLPHVEKVVILKDCGHVPMMEQPEESAAHYTAFIKQYGLPLTHNNTGKI